MSGTAGLPAQCSAGHTTVDVDCDTLCCIGDVFTNPCPGFIISHECTRAFEAGASTDADGDGLSDDAETCGLDTDHDGTFDLNLPAMGANPNHKDLFLELDWMPGQQTTRADIQAMKQAFAAAPVDAGGTTNPDGQPGINLWVDTGALVDTGAAEDGGPPGSCSDGIDNGHDGLTDGADPDCLVGDNLGGGNAITQTDICDVMSSDFVDAKNANFNLAQRRSVFRYAISAKGCDANHDGQIDSGGFGEIGGNDFIEYNHDGGTIMHELGHTLNLHHGGDVDANCKPNYVSVMNYDNQFGIRQNGGGSIIDYSPPRFAGGRGAAPLPTLVENHLNDTTVLDATDATNRYVFVDPTGAKIQRGLNQQANWNNDVDPPFETDQTINIDTNATGGGPAACANTATDSTLTGHNDWAVIALDFKQFGNSDDGLFNAPSEPEPSLAELLRLEQDLNKTDLQVTAVASPSPAVAGLGLAYTVTVRNDGPNPAGQVRLSFAPPSGVSLSAGPAGCAQQADGTELCAVPEMLAGTSRDFAFSVQVPADFVYNGGTSLQVRGDVTHLAGPDPNATNDDATLVTPVVAVSDVDLRDLGPVNVPADVLIGSPVPIGFQATADNAGPSSPTNAVVTSTINPPPGAHVSTQPANVPVTALAVGTPLPVSAQGQIVCDQPGPHSFQIASRIDLAHPGDTDPVAANNEVTTTFQVNCIVPVRINIAPHHFPNVMRGHSDGEVAVLTTAAGEYGLPLAFNALQVVSSTVRFGTQTDIWSGTGGGAPDDHPRVRIEDSFELDEKTRDGDLDMVLLFPMDETGLQPSDNTACLGGQWLDSGGVTQRFFGCDSIVLPR